MPISVQRIQIEGSWLTKAINSFVGTAHEVIRQSFAWPVIWFFCQINNNSKTDRIFILDLISDYLQVII